MPSWTVVQIPPRHTSRNRSRSTVRSTLMRNVSQKRGLGGSSQITRHHMRDDIRAFLAIQLPDDVTAALGHLADQMARAKVGGLRPVRPENMHLTLKFFGNLNAPQIEAITDTVTHTVKAIRPFTLRLGNLGAYPNNRSPRVFWVGLDGDVAPLQDAHSRIETALGQIAIEPDVREFRPYLTVARIRDRASHAELTVANGGEPRKSSFPRSFIPGLRFRSTVSTLCAASSCRKGRSTPHWPRSSWAATTKCHGGSQSIWCFSVDALAAFVDYCPKWTIRLGNTW